MMEREIGYIRGDGIGSDIWPVTQDVLTHAVKLSVPGAQVTWKEILVGERAYALTGEYLPCVSLEEMKRLGAIIKGPLTTPIGGGYRSINVTLRQELKLYACIRQFTWIPGVPSPLRHPEHVDMVLFRENLEDIYTGIEWQYDAEELKELRDWVKKTCGRNIPEDAGVGIKYISRSGTRRIVRKAIEYAVRHGRKKVTIVHKGNIMKFTEGAFCKWGQELAGSLDIEAPVTVDDCLADNMFQQILIRPREYSVLVTPNLNGDYLSDALAGMIGGLGVCPGANVGDDAALFEAAHGSAPKYAGKDKANPTALILSGAMLFEYIGWPEAARLVRQGISGVIRKRVGTYDLARQNPEFTEVGTREFGEHVIMEMEQIAGSCVPAE